MLSKSLTRTAAAMDTSSASLLNMPKRFYQLKRLHVHDAGGRNSLSGIQATVFGGSSALGSTIGGSLTRFGSQCIYPYRTSASMWDNRVKELKTTADLGYKSFVRLSDFTNPKEIGFAMKDSNVAISCVGSHVFYKKEKDFEDANIRVPMAIAQAARDSSHIKRMIYVSAAGADPNSQSKRLRTKWIGEQEVKEIFPDVTILRPTYIVNLLHQNPTISAKWGMQMKMFNRMNWQIEGMDAEVQPVFVNDIALAMMNCLKMEETIGQSYDLGGPHTYTYQEIYKMFFDITQIKPYTSLVKLEDAYDMYHLGWYQSFYRQMFRSWLYPEFMTIENQNLVVDPLNKGFADLHITPVSFGTKAHELVNEVYWLYNNHDSSKRESANN